MEKKELYVLTGFLGAGKTSFLLNILDNIKDKKIGIIQNEFGKINVDGEIVRRNGIEMTEISRGSIFCSCLKLSFVQALAEMSKKDLDYVFVESSGLADPSNIEEILNAVSIMAGDSYIFKGVICLIDGVNFPNQVKDVETVDRQLAHCNLAVINKVDLLDLSELEEVKNIVRGVNPICMISTASYGKIDLSFLSEDLTSLKWAEYEDSLNTVDNKPKTISLETGEILSKEILTNFLKKVLPDCYRIKGFFKLDDGWQQVDVVEELIDYKLTSEREISELVFLSKTSPQIIRTIDKAWKEIVDKPMKLRN
ncbi:CobW/P47K family protein [Catonella morbi ATCC 51271]|uniref:CobW/P47K family protein n=1 Tax=Catonella morbi ATCC 51271 TaxID=592026 RepID=V2Z7G8_9FIRM|nr:GTP-binding protein [Catonella morbi]ESL02880.1 CobW/P47K family protein [Catonella morbi ATCC 51271]